MGVETAENIIKNRPYRDIKQFAEKTNDIVGKEAIEALAEAGFFKGKKAKVVEEFIMYKEAAKYKKKYGKQDDDIFA